MTITGGTRFGPYEVISLLGTGGMGEVYLVRDTRLGRKVALKVLSADVTKNQDRVRRFQQEARAASALNHPNIITIYDVGQVDSSNFIATEFIDGETLRQRIKRGDMAFGEVLDIAIQVATALSAAHAAGIIHRDIKPENIMLRTDGYVKVLDFGLAKLTEKSLDPDANASDPEAETQSVVNTNPGTVMGTVSYMSPEQAKGVSLDSRTDIFSLGVVIYEMVAGRVPFEGSSISEAIAAILRKRPMPLARYSPEVPPEMERIVSKALSKDREERYQTVKDLLIDLKRFKQRLELEEEIAHSGGARVETRSLATASGGQGVMTARESDSVTQEITAELRTTSSAEYIITEIKRHKKGAAFTLAALVFVVVGLAYYVRGGGNDTKSVAVIPLVSANGDADSNNLRDVITQRIINGLSQVSGLKVMSFSSVSRFADQPINPQAVGRELGVGTILTGKIIKRDGDDSILISLELVNASDNSQIWGEQYDRKFADIRRTQEEIIKSVSERLGPKMSDEAKRRREAEAFYAEGRNYWDKRTTEGLRKGIEYFQQAIAINPDYAMAHAGLADCYNMLAAYGAEPPKVAFPKARAAAEKALEIDNSLAEAHTSLAFVRFRGEWDWPDAEREFKRAIKLRPDYAQAHQWYANYLAAMGRHAEAEEETRRTLELDPTSLIIQAHFGFVYYFAHRYDDVIEKCQKTLSLDPNFFAARRYLGLAYTQKGMYDEAIAEFQKAIAGSKGSVLMKAEMGHALAASGKKAEAERVLDELIELSVERYVSPYHMATIYAGLGNKARAFEWLEKAFQDRADYLVYLKVDPRLDSLRSDLRFTDLLRRIGLP